MNWLHTPEAIRALDAAIAWSEKNPTRESDLDVLEKKLKAHLKKRKPA